MLLVLTLLAGQADVDALLEGVSAIASPGSPGPVVVFGERAFPVVAGGAGKGSRVPVAAAGTWEAGRVVALGHDGYFGREALGKLDTGRFVLNAVRWAGRKASPRIGVGGWPDLVAHLKQAGLDAKALEKGAAPVDLDVVVLPAGWPVEGVADFVRKGGGYLSGVPGWGWLSLNAGKSLADDLPANRILIPAGLAFSDGSVDRTSEGGFDAKARPGDLLHAGKALALLSEPSKAKKEDLAQAGDSVTRAARAVPAEFARRIPPGERPAPGPDHPLKPDRALDRVRLALEVEELRKLPAAKTPAHPAAERFPGAVPAEAPRVDRVVPVDLAVPGWHSTGLYAPPGGLLKIKAPKAGLRLRIGAHTDRIWHLDTWKRVPEITTSVALAEGLTEAASPFGGLVYVDVPGRPGTGRVEVSIAGAVESPLFVLGTTTAESWKEVRKRPGPWAELATRKIILTVPSRVVRDLEDPEGLMRFWDSVMDSIAELASIPAERTRPERIVADVQISAGYMHSGYPIMTHLDVEKKAVDVAALKQDGWGYWHELGHNHQVGDWTFEGTGEVTNNLFTVYVCAKICGQAEGHSDVRAAKRVEKRRKHLAAGAPFDGWKKDPFLALDMYLLMQEAFGWDAFKKVFGEYRTLPAAERPKSDADKRDQWMIRFSKACGRNLGPYFQAWGVPVTDAARAAVAGLPAWMPEGWGAGEKR